MPLQAPPERFTGTPLRWPLPAGTTLSRVHQERFSAASYNPGPTVTAFGGGRFDSTPADVHGFLYAALDDGPAVSETLLRDVPSNSQGARVLLRKSWAGRELSRLRTTVDLQLVALRTGAELGAVGQDSWLTGCDADHYPHTREWGHWLRRQDRAAHGAAWFSKRDPGATVMVLWQDRCPPNALEPASGPLNGARCRFDDHEGALHLREILAPYRVSIRLPQG